MRVNTKNQDNIADIKITAMSTAPNGWLICDGSAISRISYGNLFTAIGTAYGAGDGSTTFNIPNLKGRIPVGLDSTQIEFDTLGEIGGAKTHTLTIAEMPSHNHNVESVQTASQNAWAGGDVRANSTTRTTTNTGGGGAHNNLQPYIVMNYIIKY